MTIKELKQRFKEILITWHIEVNKRLDNFERDSIDEYETGLRSLVDELTDAALILSERKHKAEVESIEAARKHMKNTLNSNCGRRGISIRATLADIEMDLYKVQ